MIWLKFQLIAVIMRVSQACLTVSEAGLKVRTNVLKPSSKG
jgi:hypothetical protein